MGQFEVVFKSLIENKTTYFTKITAEDREKVKKWIAEQNGATEREKEFLKVVKEAVREVEYDYWIATLEPSMAMGMIYYAKGELVKSGLSCNEWSKLANEFAPERGSRLAKLYELFIWYALRVVNGLWTLDYVANDSSSGGNYWNAPGSTNSIEKAGARVCGGYGDGQGNTYRIVTYEDRFVSVGGNHNTNGKIHNISYVNHYIYPNCIQNYGSGVCVLIK